MGRGERAKRCATSSRKSRLVVRCAAASFAWITDDEVCFFWNRKQHLEWQRSRKSPSLAPHTSRVHNCFNHRKRRRTEKLCRTKQLTRKTIDVAVASLLPDPFPPNRDHKSISQRKHLLFFSFLSKWYVKKSTHTAQLEKKKERHSFYGFSRRRMKGEERKAFWQLKRRAHTSKSTRHLCVRTSQKRVPSASLSMKAVLFCCLTL